MTAGNATHQSASRDHMETLSDTTLHMLSTFLDELVQEEALGFRAQMVLHRVATPICLLANGDTSMFYNNQHPARQIFDSIVQIAKLSGEEFGPGDMLFKTLMESIKNLQANNVAGIKCLERVSSDLKHIVKLARIRAPIDKKQNLGSTGAITEAKIKSALLVVQQANKFVVSNVVLYFSLTQWLELLTIAMLKFGAEKKSVSQLERMTFLLFYLSSGKAGVKLESLSKHLFAQIQALSEKLGDECLGHQVDVKKLHQKVEKLLRREIITP
jgi:hypothetical protein